MNLGRGNYFDQLSTFRISKDDFSILPSTKDYQSKIFELIESAKSRIYIAALYLQDDAAGTAVLTALYEAKEKNPQLDIKVFVDFLRAQRGLIGHKTSTGNIGLYRELNGQYQHPIEIYGVPVKSREFLGVLHLKGLVFDDTVLYSGASINDIYLHYADRYRADRYQVINSADLADSFVRYLNKNLTNSDAVQLLTNDQIVPVKSFRPALRRQKISLRGSEYQFIVSRPSEKTDISLTPLIGFGSRKNQLNKTILQLIKQTKTEIIIFTPYFNFPSKVHKAALQLLRKKIKVTVIVGDKKANDFYIPEGEDFEKIGILPYVYESNLKSFLKSNQKHIDTGCLEVHLWRDQSNSFHLKGINSDQTNYLITGHNINPRAWRLDLENGILVQDPSQQLINKFDAELSLVMAHCTKVNHFDEIDNTSDYPAEVKRLLKNMKRTRFDKILNQLL
ncbi:MAG: CDP-diacylglycerol--serine O-phosphatidyltransferase [Polaribacter sp.]|jgi:CDP-diacylglycerol--serine O-phosphatidyltransferase